MENNPELLKYKFELRSMWNKGLPFLGVKIFRYEIFDLIYI